MITYVIKSSLSLICLFGLYWFLLRREKIFVFNRFFLISSVVFSLVMPFISVPVNLQTLPIPDHQIPSIEYIINETIPTDNVIQVSPGIQSPDASGEETKFNFSSILVVLYFSGLMLFLIRFLRNIFLLRKSSASCDKRYIDGFRLVLTSEEVSPCCFFSNIYLNRDDYLNGKIDNELLDHELEHIKQFHTVDILIIELVKIAYWFNPVLIMYDRAIRLNHEYLADNRVINGNTDLNGYMNKLLNIIIGRGNMTLTSGSFHSSTKQRLLMMLKPKSGSVNYGIRITLAVSLLVIFSLFMSFKYTATAPSEATADPVIFSASKLGNDHSQQASGKQVVSEGFIQNSIRGIIMTEDGKPLIRAMIIAVKKNNLPFRVGTGFDGRFNLFDLKQGDSIKVECLGFITQTLKADFSSEMVVRLERDPDYKGKIITTEIREVNFINHEFRPTNSLVVINGSVLDYNESLALDPDLITSLRILKDDEALNKYGEKGKDGVVEIELHEKNDKTLPDSDTSLFKTSLSINRSSNNGEFIDIPVRNLYSMEVWTYDENDYRNDKRFRTIGIMTREFFQVKGKVIKPNGRPLSGVRISSTDNPVKTISNRKGFYKIEDVRENSIIEYSRAGYKPYYLGTKFSVPYKMDMTVQLEKARRRGDEE